jgi:hypothetical protein
MKFYKELIVWYSFEVGLLAPRSMRELARLSELAVKYVTCSICSF